MPFGEEALLETSFWGEQAFCSETSFKQGKNKFLGNKLFLEAGFLEKNVRNKLFFRKKGLFQKQAFGEQTFPKTAS